MAIDNCDISATFAILAWAYMFMQVSPFAKGLPTGHGSIYTNIIKSNYVPKFLFLLGVRKRRARFLF